VGHGGNCLFFMGELKNVVADGNIKNDAGSHKFVGVEI